MSGFRSTSNVRLVLMLACGRGWGEQGSSTPAHRLCCEADLRSSSGGRPAPLRGGSGRTSLIDQASVRLVVGQPPWAVEDRKPAIRVFVHAHGHLDEMMPVALPGNLKPHSSPHFSALNTPLNSGASATAWAKRSMRGASLCSGMVGIRS